MGESPDLHPLKEDFEVSFILFSEPSLLIFLHSEGLDDPVAGDRLVKKSGERAHPLKAFPAKLPEPLSEFFDRYDGNRKDDESNHSQFPVPVENNSGQPQDGHGIFNEAGDRIGDRSLDEIDIIGDPGDEDTGGCSGEEREGEVLKVVVKPLPDVGHHPQTNAVHQIGLAVIEEPFQEKEENDGNRKQKEHLHILLEQQVSEAKLDDNIFYDGRNSLFLEENPIQSGFNEEGLARRQKGNEDHTGHGQDQFYPVRFDKLKKAAVKNHIDYSENKGFVILSGLTCLPVGRDARIANKRLRLSSLNSHCTYT